jgi:hypothetical protein
MQATIDWMRFWLQGKERDVPEDPDRFTRWQHIKADWENVLKAEQVAEQPAAGAGR